MKATPLRGVLLVALAVVLGFLVLRGVADREQVPIGVDSSLFEPTATTVATPDPSLTVTDETTGTAPLPTAPVVDVATARPPAEVSVLVANGTEIAGQAGRLTDVLRNQGFNTRQARNADPRPTSVIYYRPGFAVEAQVVRNALQTDTPITTMPEPDPVVGADIDLGPVDVFVLVGGDSLSTS